MNIRIMFYSLLRSPMQKSVMCPFFSRVLCDSTTRLVRGSVGPSHFIFLCFCSFWLQVTWITAPAHPHATGVALYPALFLSFLQPGSLTGEGNTQPSDWVWVSGTHRRNTDKDVIKYSNSKASPLKFCLSPLCLRITLFQPPPSNTPLPLQTF